ncbi:MAG: carbon-nitrogen hydrolase family protein [Planctomycetaceae bacterium]|nr:carbon-nitrogen hydrolase family protein [Planctomycetaceae bacterium]
MHDPIFRSSYFIVMIEASVLSFASLNAAENEADKSPTVKVAGIVLKWVRGDKAENYRRAEPMIREAAANGAEIVCTTECFLDGYAIADKSIPLGTYRSLGEPIPTGEYFRKLAALADELNIHLAAGMTEADGDLRYNVTVLIGPEGDLLGKYRKHRLQHELVRNRPGTTMPSFATKHGKVGIMICADRREPKLVEGICRDGAEYLLCPSGGMFGPAKNDQFLQDRSRENGKWIVFVHPAEFLVTNPQGEIAQRTILGDRLLVSRDEIDTAADSRQVFYAVIPR